MEKFIPREKLSKKKKREADKENRVTWDFCPVTRKTKKQNIYNRKKLPRVSKQEWPRELIFSAR
ncbi:MAG: hypothetical protein ACOYJB_09535 [Christensenellaceae bacterium]